MKRSRIPGVTVHKSTKDALQAIGAEMEQQHFATVNREKAKALKAKKAAKAPPG